MKKLVIASIFSVAAAAMLVRSPALAEEKKEMKPAGVEVTLVAIDYKGTKMWLPGTIHAKKGDLVRIKLINKIPGEGSVHGFAIDAFGVKEAVAEGEPKTVEFKADKEGIFRLYCHLHPAHVGGQLVILP